MITLKDEIFMTGRELEKLKQEFDEMKPGQSDDRFKYANKKSEIYILERKLEDLKKQQEENDKQKGKKEIQPINSEENYDFYPDKKALDILKIKNYDLLKKDLSIKRLGVAPIIGSCLEDPVNTYAVKDNRGTYRLTIRSDNNLEKDLNSSVQVTFDMDKFFSHEMDNRIRVINGFIKDFTGSPINFIITDSGLTSVSFGRIGGSDLRFNERNTLDFDKYLDSVFIIPNRNIAYLGYEIQKKIFYLDFANGCIDKINPPKMKIVKQKNFKNFPELISYNITIRDRIVNLEK